MALFCFACAGASAAPFQRWRRQAPPWLRIVPVERPGRGIRLGEPHVRTFEEIIRLLTREISRDLPQNYALFGHSLGALLAFGCAQEIRRRGLHPPKALAVAGSAAPSRRDDSRLTSLSTDQDFINELRRQCGTPEEIYASPELLRLILDATAADFAVCASFQYRPMAPLSIPVFIFGGRRDEIKEQALEAWRVETTADTACDLFEGGHFFLREHEAEFLTMLTSRLKSTLENPLSERESSLERRI
ncbi:MAG: thioesterase [Nitrobacter sp.]